MIAVRFDTGLTHIAVNHPVWFFFFLSPVIHLAAVYFKHFSFAFLCEQHVFVYCAVNDSAEAARFPQTAEADIECCFIRGPSQNLGSHSLSNAFSPDKHCAASAPCGGLCSLLSLTLEEWPYNLTHFPRVLVMKESGKSS